MLAWQFSELLQLDVSQHFIFVVQPLTNMCVGELYLILTFQCYTVWSDLVNFDR